MTTEHTYALVCSGIRFPCAVRVIDSWGEVQGWMEPGIIEELCPRLGDTEQAGPRAVCGSLPPLAGKFC